LGRHRRPSGRCGDHEASRRTDDGAGRHIRTKGWTEAEAAGRLDVTRPRISDLLRGKITLFSIDTLVGMLTQAGLRVEMRVGEAA